MLRNYIATTLRFLLRYKSYSLINILGLATGIACSIIIYLWVLDEINYDKFHKNYNQIFRLVQDQKNSNGVFKVASTPAPMSLKFKDDFPEILQVARYLPLYNNVLFSCNNKEFYDNGIGFVDPEFFEIFDFKLVAGSLEQFKELSTSLFITEDFAKKHFGNQNPIGKDIIINQSTPHTIAGVLENPPKNSHIQFKILGPFKRPEELGWNFSWHNNNTYSYILFNTDYDYKSMNAKFIKNLEDVYDYEITTNYYLQPLSEVYLKSDFNIDLYTHSETKYQYVYIFAIVGIILILIVVINYMNLSTARATRRAKEIGIRKAHGASRNKIMRLFLWEFTKWIAISLIIAWPVAYLYLNKWLQKFAYKTSLDFYIFILAGLLVILIAWLSVAYQSIRASKTNPAKILKYE